MLILHPELWRNKWTRIQRKIELELTTLRVVATVEQRSLVGFDLPRRNDDPDIETEDDDWNDEEDCDLGDVRPGLPYGGEHFRSYVAITRRILPEVALYGMQYHWPDAQANDDDHGTTSRAELFTSERMTDWYVTEQEEHQEPFSCRVSFSFQLFRRWFTIRVYQREQCVTFCRIKVSKHGPMLGHSIKDNIE